MILEKFEIQKMSTPDLGNFVTLARLDGTLTREQFWQIYGELKTRGTHPEVLAGIAGEVHPSWRSSATSV
jgi:hypothetical protein